nr:MAG TPA: hypothetical protein [Caudoviricetes sp.]
MTFTLFCVNIVLTMGYCHFVNVKRIQDLASAGFLSKFRQKKIRNTTLQLIF